MVLRTFLATFALILTVNTAVAQTAPTPTTPTPTAPKDAACPGYAETTQRLIRSGGARVVAMSTGTSIIDVWQGENGWTAFEVKRDGTMCRVAGGPGVVHTTKAICVDPARCPRI